MWENVYVSGQGADAPYRAEWKEQGSAWASPGGLSDHVSVSVCVEDTMKWLPWKRGFFSPQALVIICQVQKCESQKYVEVVKILCANSCLTLTQKYVVYGAIKQSFAWLSLFTSS